MGLTDMHTPLNRCMALILRAKKPEQYWNNLIFMHNTPEALDAIRRHSNGMFGATLDQQKLSIKSKRHKKIFDEFLKSKVEFDAEHLSLDKMREIAKLLIKNRADTNMEHSSPIYGYTPLMSAAELDERILFELMLVKGGKPEKTYINSMDGRKIDCWEIAHHFQAKNVMQVLEDIKSHFKLKS